MTPLQIVFNWPIIVIFGKALLNWFQIEKQHKYPKHGRQIAVVILLAFIYIGLSRVHSFGQWQLALTILLYQASTYWFFFDGLLNLMRGKKLLYIGIPDKDDAKTDQFFSKYPNLYVWSKIAMVPVIIYSAILIEKLILWLI